VLFKSPCDESCKNETDGYGRCRRQHTLGQGWEGQAQQSSNSMAILMEWLTTLGNYSKLKGDNSNGATKIRIIRELAQQINAKGVQKERTVKSVMNKLHHLTATYRKASDWANQTGAGVLETEGRKPFNQAVSLFLRHCLVFS
jgi:hypothetical protein